jgi:hypothetical protein
MSAARGAGGVIASFEHAEFRTRLRRRRLAAAAMRALISPHAASYKQGGKLGPGIVWSTRSVLTALAETCRTMSTAGT